jgi:hypothetical protein
MTAEDQPAEDQTAAGRQYNEIKISAVLVPSGQHPGPELYGHIDNPVRLPVRMQQRGDAPGSADSQSPDHSAGSATAAPAGTQPALDVNLPPAPNGARSLAPRRTPRSDTTSPIIPD